MAQTQSAKATIDPTEVTHLHGCPAPADRMESFPDVIPPKPEHGIGPRRVRVVRCQQCGAMEVKKEAQIDG